MGSSTGVLKAGVILARRYRLEHHIATGGMSEVWQATDTTLNRSIAVKILPPLLATDPDFVSRFRAEARLMAQLRHPGIADVYDAGESEMPDGGRALFLVMEHIQGQPLSRRVAELGRLEPDEVLSLVSRTAQALHVAHRHGIVHRDVKPGNLLVKPDGTVVLVDFGVARSATVTAITSANAVVGTALYMAPEQATGSEVSAATDIYSLGASAYHCLAGRPPFPGDNPLEVAYRHVHEDPPPLPDDIPEPVRYLIGRAMSKDPQSRFPDAATFASAAAAVANGSADAVTRRIMPVLADLNPWRSRATLVGVASAVVIAAAATAMTAALRPAASDTIRQHPASPSAPAVTPSPWTTTIPLVPMETQGGSVEGAGSGQSFAPGGAPPATAGATSAVPVDAGQPSPGTTPPPTTPPPVETTTPPVEPTSPTATNTDPAPPTPTPSPT